MTDMELYDNLYIKRKTYTMTSELYTGNMTNQKRAEWALDVIKARTDYHAAIEAVHNGAYRSIQPTFIAPPRNRRS